jgi:hypothetical protein
MSGTFGLTSALPLMRFDLASSSWRTCEDTSLWDLEMSSPTFPEWGMTRAGVLYELPTLERPINAPASSSLPTLPTPRSAEAQHSGRSVPAKPGQQQGLTEVVNTQLLPTPRTSDTNGTGLHGTGGPDLRTVVSLLPTPSASDGSGAMTPAARMASGDGYGPALRDIPFLLPTPTTADGTGGHAVRGGSRGDERLLTGVAMLIWDDTDPRSTAGSTSSKEEHPLLPFPGAPDDRDSTRSSSNG